jgi:hypothetical protein
MEMQTTVLPIKVGETIVLARVTGSPQDESEIAGEGQVAGRIPNFDDVVVGIEEMSKALVTVFEKIRPDRASVEFTVGISIDAGKLVALFFDPKFTGGVKVALQWGKSNGGSATDE